MPLCAPFPSATERSSSASDRRPADAFSFCAPACSVTWLPAWSMRSLAWRLVSPATFFACSVAVVATWLVASLAVWPTFAASSLAVCVEL